MTSAPARAPRVSMAGPVLPMMAFSAEPFDAPDYLYEPKWDGIRCIAFLERRRAPGGAEGISVRLQSRNTKDLTGLYPELATVARAFRIRQAVVDGEIVAAGGKRGTFRHIAARNSLKDPGRIARAAAAIPTTLVVFDILLLDGEDVTTTPLAGRRDLLARVFTPDEAAPVALAPSYREKGLDLYREAIRLDLEGIMAKRADSPYLPGKRSRLWLKVKVARTMSCLLCGFWPHLSGGGTVTGVRSLVLGGYRAGTLTYAGKVGTGFSVEESSRLARTLMPLAIPAPPFGHRPPDCEASTVWVRPVLVCEVSYTEILPTWRLRHPSFLGLRGDVPPESCELPPPGESGG